MHDVFILYNRPVDTAEFDTHYRDIHVSLVSQMPLLREFTYGHVVPDDSGYYFVARLSYESADAAAQSMSSPEGERTGRDVANFASGGVTVLNVASADGWARSSAGR